MATFLSRTGNHRLILIGQVSAYFALLILTLRNFAIYPAHHYGLLVVILLIGFLPSFIYQWLPSRTAPFILVMNALALVSFVFVFMQEWALAGVFVLVPVYALLFRDRIVYLFATGSALVLNVVLAWIFLYDARNPAFSLVTMMDVMTVFMILVFIIYFVVKSLRTRYQEEARYLQTILTFSKSVEARDPYTQGHSERVAAIARLIAESIPQLNPETVHNSGLIHDVGKLSIPDSILLKESRLTDDEYETMKSHTINGAKLCESLDIHSDIVLGVLHHHERWDGRGYPNGLAGENIPLIGRVLSIADAIDAMSSKRAYRNGLPAEVVLEQVRQCSNTQFDPSIASIAVAKWSDIQAYYRRFSESDGVELWAGLSTGWIDAQQENKGRANGGEAVYLGD